MERLSQTAAVLQSKRARARGGPCGVVAEEQQVVVVVVVVEVFAKK